MKNTINHQESTVIPITKNSIKNNLTSLKLTIIINSLQTLIALIFWMEMLSLAVTLQLPHIRRVVQLQLSSQK